MEIDNNNNNNNDIETIITYNNINSLKLENVCKIKLDDLIEKLNNMIYSEMNNQVIRHDYIDTIQRDGFRVEFRRKLVTWMMNLEEDLHISQETTQLAVSYLDRYLSIRSVPRTSLQLLALVCTLIASKLHESHCIPLKALENLVQKTFSAKDILAMEKEILSVLSWKIYIQTPVAFMNHFSQLIPVAEFRKSVRNFAEVCLDCTLAEYSFLRYPPYVLGVASVACGLEVSKYKTSANFWTSYMEQYFPDLNIMTSSIVRQCAIEMLALFQKTFPEYASRLSSQNNCEKKNSLPRDGTISPDDIRANHSIDVQQHHKNNHYHDDEENDNEVMAISNSNTDNYNQKEEEPMTISDNTNISRRPVAKRPHIDANSQ